MIYAIIGFVVGLIFWVAVFINSHPLTTSETLKKECELNLPRSQQCIMQYVPEIKSKKLKGDE